MYDIRKTINEIESVDRTHFNEKIILHLAIDKKDTPKPSFIKIDFLAKDEPLPDELTYDYGDFIIIRKTISYSEFIDMLYHIEDQTKFGIRPIQDNIVKTEQWDRFYISSNQSWGYIQPEFPTLYFQSRFDQQTSGIIPQEILAAKDTPPYPNASKAIAHIFGIRVGWNQERYFVISIPDYRARIKTVRISNNKILTDIDARYISEKELFYQFYLGGNNQAVSESKVEIKNGISTISIPKDSDHYLVLLMTKSGELLDKKEISTAYPSQDSSVIVEIPSYSLMEMISNGEGKHIEFKSKLDNPEPFITSVVSFSNTGGGRIFIGVNDYGEIIGIDEPDAITKKVFEWIAQYCDPRVDVKPTHSTDLNVIVVDVPKGVNKPYFLKTGGCFVRHGATDRQATRVELESMKKPQDMNERRGLALE
ncbi:Putative AAA ATPase [Nitrosotalea devaniterrae]|uniref:AAA ATPase n=1 Tax=Nitrosotalea devaniterrae TaxID=1078905 RepID=A0A128A653_9ARCH|nr:Putative AAA ATPase [Candidatus Nitrosotalea devanaterra]